MKYFIVLVMEAIINFTHGLTKQIAEKSIRGNSYGSKAYMDCFTNKWRSAAGKATKNRETTPL